MSQTFGNEQLVLCDIKHNLAEPGSMSQMIEIRDLKIIDSRQKSGDQRSYHASVSN